MLNELNIVIIGQYTIYESEYSAAIYGSVLRNGGDFQYLMPLEGYCDVSLEGFLLVCCFGFNVSSLPEFEV